MGSAARSLTKAEQLPQGDIVRILLEQHARIAELCGVVGSADDTSRRSEAFAELRALLAVHQSVEELVVRPRTRIIAEEGIADQRTVEEKEAAQAVIELEGQGVDGRDFDAKFAEFAQAVAEHAAAEEADEFGCLIDSCDERERGRLGAMLLRSEQLASEHPHSNPTGSTVMPRPERPYAALLDSARQRLGRVSRAL